VTWSEIDYPPPQEWPSEKYLAPFKDEAKGFAERNVDKIQSVIIALNNNGAFEFCFVTRSYEFDWDLCDSISDFEMDLMDKGHAKVPHMGMITGKENEQWLVSHVFSRIDLDEQS
jgi:hypothetical protein